MARRITAREVGERHLATADQAKYKHSARFGGIDTDFVLHMERARVVPGPEPVTWRGLNGREPEEWEEPLIVAARERERRRELVLLAGTAP